MDDNFYVALVLRGEGPGDPGSSVCAALCVGGLNVNPKDKVSFIWHQQMCANICGWLGSGGSGPHGC